jgi:hypothetical protein
VPLVETVEDTEAQPRLQGIGSFLRARAATF